MNILRPGISAKFLEQAKVRQLGPGEAANLCAISQGGIWIPYLTWEGSPLRDQSGRELGRLLVDHPEHHTVYHCSCESREHAYLPPNIKEQKSNGDLFLCDSEFRAMCLAEAGCAALGLQGLWGFLAPNSRLVSEMVEAVHLLTPRRIILVGNSDSCLDYEFSKAAISLRLKLGVATLHLLRIPIHLPVGVDEVRELLREAFSKCWSKWLDEAVPVTAETKASDLAVDLITQEAVDDRMFSANLVEHMIRLADEINEQADGDFRPWKDGFKGGGALTPIRLSDLVRPYDIEPQSIRQSQNPRTAKGYYRSCFQNAYKRYISRVYSNQNGTPAQNDDDQATPNISD